MLTPDSSTLTASSLQHRMETALMADLFKPCLVTSALVVITMFGMLLEHQTGSMGALLPPERLRRNSPAPFDNFAESSGVITQPSLSIIPSYNAGLTADTKPSSAAEMAHRASIKPKNQASSAAFSASAKPVSSSKQIARPNQPQGERLPTPVKQASSPASSAFAKPVSSSKQIARPSQPQEERLPTPASTPAAMTVNITERLILPFAPVPHNPAVTVTCETCGLNLKGSVHTMNQLATRKIALGYFRCKLPPGQHHFVLLICFCPASGLVGQLIHAARTHEIHVFVPNGLLYWWHFYDAAFKRAKVSYTFLHNNSLVAGNESSYSDTYEIGNAGDTLCKNCLRDLVYQHNKIPFDAPCSSVLFISRDRSRSILDQGTLVNRLDSVASNYNLSLVVFYGNESVTILTSMFAGTNTCVVPYYENWLLVPILIKCL
jgi:hypothetical protein